MTEIVDKNGKPIELRDYVASECVGVQIGTTGHKLWVCIDGAAVLRVVAPTIELGDMRIQDAPAEAEAEGLARSTDGAGG